MSASTKDSDSEPADLQSWLAAIRNPNLSPEEMVKCYSDWIKNAGFDSLALDGGHATPALTVKYFCDGFPDEEKSSAKILDVGAGTGLVARELRKKGFCHIDALDPSEDMLSIARKDNLYENYYCEFLTEKQLPIAPDTYDGLTSSAGFGVSHIPCAGLHEMIRVVKPGGTIVIVASEDHIKTLPEYKDRLVPLMNRLEEEGKWKTLMFETGVPYIQNETSMAWKFQVMEKSAK